MGTYLSWILLLAVAPLAGLTTGGQTARERLLDFPAVVPYPHAPFSWGVFLALTLVVVSAVFPIMRWLIRPAVTAPSDAHGNWPIWGWGGVLLMAVAWWLAWHRYPWFTDWQAFTFTPLWIGYVLVVNALTCRRTGSCLLTRRSHMWLLFPISAAFWWYFEFLNLLARNWYYIGLPDFSRFEYALYATLPFSTVLPAVCSTRELLATLPAFQQRLLHRTLVRITRPKWVAAIALCVATAMLVSVGTVPDYGFTFLWIAPILLLVALQVLNGEPTVLAPLAIGDWRALVQSAVAALVCGFFWELWNSGGIVQWRYAIPFVDRFHIFEMPLIGYAGYLAFGIECLAIEAAVVRWWRSRSARVTASN